MNLWEYPCEGKFSSVDSISSSLNSMTYYSLYGLSIEALAVAEQFINSYYLLIKVLIRAETSTVRLLLRRNPYMIQKGIG